MAGIGMATIFIHCGGGLFLIGFNGGFVSSASRAFGGDNLKKYQQYFVQGLTNLGFVLLLFILIICTSDKILKFTRQS